jgi:hypothetical protein
MNAASIAAFASVAFLMSNSVPTAIQGIFLKFVSIFEYLGLSQILTDSSE